VKPGPACCQQASPLETPAPAGARAQLGHEPTRAWGDGLGNLATARLIGSARVAAPSRVGVIQRKGARCEDEDEREALIQRFPSQGDPLAGALEADPAAGSRDAAADPAPGRAAAPSFRLDDEAKPAFLASLREAVCATADEGMAGTGSTSGGCPWIEHWFGHYASQPATHVARSIRRFAPETADASSQSEVIALIAARVRRSVDQWARSGEISYQEAFNPEVPGTGTVSHATRVLMIDAALGYYNCFGADLQRQYTGHRDRLLGHRTEEQRLSGRETTPPPTECRRPR
jgi:hypothetical protein